MRLAFFGERFLRLLVAVSRLRLNGLGFMHHLGSKIWIKVEWIPAFRLATKRRDEGLPGCALPSRDPEVPLHKLT